MTFVCLISYIMSGINSACTKPPFRPCVFVSAGGERLRRSESFVQKVHSGVTGLRKMQACFVVLLPLLLPLINAQVPHWGPCPEPATQPAFSFKQFMGRWFEIAKLPAQFEKGRCIETNFTLQFDGTARVISSEILKGELRTIDGTAVVEDQKNQAKLGISFSYVLPYTPYWILSTDYVNSALVYSCTDVLRLFHVDFAWILSRSRSLPAATIIHGKEVFAKNNIDVSRMIASRQQDCDKNL